VVAFLFTRPVVAILAGTRSFQAGKKWSGVDMARLGVHTPPSRQPAAAAGRR
jgi:hypothetical protein